MIDYESIIILGAGESGVGAAILASQKGKEVFVSDYGEIQEKHKSELVKHNIPFEEKGHDFERLGQVDLVVKSPGIPEKSKVIQQLRELNKTIISEIEFASWYYQGFTIAITGSNGKTTTASLLFHVLDGIKDQVALGGNIGRSFSRLVADGFTDGYLVLEVSSFQLDDIQFFKPNIGILLNITADHLDRYDYEVRNYAESKMSIFRNMKDEDLAILNKHDHWTNELKAKIQCEIIQCEESDGEVFETSLKGRHNQFNISCAVEALKKLKIPESEILERIKTFKAVRHRMETVAIINGVEYINDSKATNVDAVKYALEGMTKDLVWIAGGTDKGNDYSELMQYTEKIKALICLGVDNEKLIESFGDHIKDISETKEMKEAIKIATKKAQQDEAILLSPACASFDLFKNYEDRGNQFEEAVFDLINE